MGFFHYVKNETTNSLRNCENNVETINQFKLLNYIKKYLDVQEFRLFLYDKDRIKIIARDEKQAYFKYDNDNNDVLFIEEDLEEYTI